MKNCLLVIVMLLAGDLMFCNGANNNLNVTVQDTSKMTGKFITVSFISKGPGIDREGYDKIIKHLNGHPAKLKYEEVQKGREGERTIKINVTELKKKEAKKIQKELEGLVTKKDLVFVKRSEVGRIRSKF